VHRVCEQQAAVLNVSPLYQSLRSRCSRVVSEGGVNMWPQ